MASRNVVNFFEDILDIPRPSGKEELIAGYLVYFAQKNGYEYYVDEYSNVIIKKPGTFKTTPIILQAHTDMVCVGDNKHDFNNEPVKWYVEDGYYRAKNMSLGADNGAGVAIILSILNDPTLIHPPLEAVFTTQEETTMKGAKFLDYKKLKGKRLIGLDSTEDTKITVSCAGMATMMATTKLEKIESNRQTYQLAISGLLGGHSGVDIDKSRGNAIKILANMLEPITDIEIVSISGGSKINVIPSDAKCIFKTKHDLSKVITEFKKICKSKYKTIKVSFKKVKQHKTAITNEISRNVIDFLVDTEDGVLKKNETGTILASRNLAVIEQEKDIMIKMSLRSSLFGLDEYYISKSETLARKYKLKFSLEDKSPFFIRKSESRVRNALSDSYKRLFKEDIILEDIHAGLEGGVFSDNIKDLDVCVIGANIYDCHSVEEKVEIASMRCVRKWLVDTLANIDKPNMK